MQVGAWDWFTTAVGAAGSAAKTKIEDGSIADALIKGGSAMITAHSNMQLAKLAAKQQRVNPDYIPAGGKRVEVPPPSAWDSLSSNTGTVAVGIGIMAALFIGVKLLDKPKRGK
jgi:hypothetical protein